MNEYSTRYSEAIDSMQKTDASEWRTQNSNNKQGSSGYLEEWPEGFTVDDNGTVNIDNAIVGEGYQSFSYSKKISTPGELLSRVEQDLQEHAHSVYKLRLQMGVAREQARKDLPLSTYTEAYWKCNLHNLLHFLSLRMDSHAQQEIREYANVIGEQIVKPLFPIVWEAFEDYRLHAMTLTSLEQEVLRTLFKDLVFDPLVIETALESISNNRERAETSVKLNQFLNIR